MNNIDIHLDDIVHVEENDTMEDEAEENDTMEDEAEEGNKIFIELFNFHLCQY